MVGTPPCRHSSRHRRVASILALRAIRSTSPVRRAERRTLQRERVRRRAAAFYRGLLAFYGAPPEPPWRRRRVELQQPVVDHPVVVSSDTSADNIRAPMRAQPLVIDLDSSVESLPNIDPQPQFQLPVEPLVDLGNIDATQKLIPPLQHQTFREACVLLQRLQLPALQPKTPPPDPGRDWVALETAVATFDGQQHMVLAPTLELQQPQCVPVPQHVPVHFATPPPMPPVDWATIAHALYSIAEAGNRQQHYNPN